MKRKWMQILQLMLAISVFTSLCNAQSPVTDSAGAKIKAGLLAYYKKYPQEKIFIHTNQSVYTSGQTLWYAVYATAYGVPSALSKIVYVQLLDSAGRVVVQNKLPLNKGFSHGNMDLPDSLKSGWYRLRGFTGWMMNFGKDEYFHQNIYVQNTADTIRDKEHKVAAKKFHVDFFPEGGNMVNGQECNVAFRAENDAGQPVNIDGQILDNNNQIAAQVITTHDGMGLFRLDVQGGNYTAVINFPDKTAQKIALPTVRTEGIAMQVNTNPLAYIRLKIAYTGPAVRYKNVVLAAFQNNGNVSTYSLKLAKGINQFDLQKSLFSTGILRLTIFDSNNLPLAERLVFIDNHDNPGIILSADTLNSAPRAKQAFDLALTNATNRFDGGNFSVSVTDADAFTKDSTENIRSSFLLSSELRGPVHNSGWYFSSADHMQLLDLVMLTNGWRHFKWDEIMNPSPVKLKYPVEGAQYIAGKIEDYQKPPAGKPQDVIKLLIVNQDSSKYIGYVNPDSTGSFILRNYDHRGLSTLYMETTGVKNKVLKLTIRLFSTLNDSLKNVTNMPMSINQNADIPVTKYLLSNGRIEDQGVLQVQGTTLKTVVIKTKKENPTNKVIADHVNVLYNSPTEYTLDLVNNPAPDVSLVDYIKGRFPGLQIYGDNDSVTFIYLSTSTIRGNPQPYVYLNETQVKFGEVADINLRNVALIRFMPPPVGFAPYNGGSVGALMIYTKKGADEVASIESREKFDQYTFNGYTITREFSSPDYSIKQNNPLPDHRTTLYWNPHLLFDNTGHAKFHFYFSDNTRHFRVIIQGMDADGHAAYLDESF